MKNNLDLNIWVTQQDLAKERGVTVQCVNNWIRRHQVGSKKVGNSRLILVDRTSVTVGNQSKK